MKPASPRQAVINVIASQIIKYHKTYCWPKLATIQLIIFKIYGHKISIRSVSYHLQQAQKLLFINSYRRRGRAADGTIYNKPSNRQLTTTGINWLKKNGVYIPMWLQKWAYTGELPSPDTPDPALDPQRPRQEARINIPVSLKSIFAPLIT